MKKFAVLLMTAVMLTALTGCGGKNDASNGDGSGESKYAEAIEILDAVFGVYEEADKFAVYGGNQENPVMDAPGKFDVTKTDELSYVLGLPEAMASNGGKGQPSGKPVAKKMWLRPISRATS